MKYELPCISQICHHTTICTPHDFVVGNLGKYGSMICISQICYHYIGTTMVMSCFWFWIPLECFNVLGVIKIEISRPVFAFQISSRLSTPHFFIYSWVPLRIIMDVWALFIRMKRRTVTMWAAGGFGGLPSFCKPVDCIVCKDNIFELYEWDEVRWSSCYSFDVLEVAGKNSWTQINSTDRTMVSARNEYSVPGTSGVDKRAVVGKHQWIDRRHHR